MCGIAGIYAYRESAPPVDEQELLHIREHMIKRGPDGAGLWISPDQKIGLAHRRLAIIDLSAAGAQPMATADGNFRITFNGEIYNYRELRNELEAKGYRFRSNSDTEVLLHLYAERGPDMVHALRGMYAFGIWNERKKGMFLARDPFGIKPLYYANDGRSLRFASQVKALLSGGAIGNEAEPAGHAGFFVWGSVPEPFTLYKAIRAVPAGASIWVDGNGLRGPTAFFSIAEEFAKAQEQNPEESDGSRAERALAALRDSVRHHMIADVPVGAFLSAGLDSATITALASEVADINLRTLTLGFKEYQDTQIDETVLAADVAARYKASHETRWVTRGDFEVELPRILEAMDQPSIDGINTYFVSKAAAYAGMKVAISGLGGDELFGGYPSFRDVPRMRRAASAFSGLSRFGKAFRCALSPLVRQFTSPKYAGVMEYGGSYGGAYLLRRAVFMPWELPRLMDPELATQGWEDLQQLTLLEGSARGLSKERQIISALELSWYMRNQLLRDSDWAGMANSLEIRVPYLDVSFFRSLAPLISGKRSPSKVDLARALKPQLPDEMISRAKTGFTVPVREWCIDMFGKQAEARGIRGWAKHVMLHDSPTAADGIRTKAHGRSPVYVSSPQTASIPCDADSGGSETQALDEASAAATPNLNAASDAMSHSVLVTLVHRSQALLISALYDCINALLYAVALLLWPRRRPVSAERVCVFRIGYIGDIVCALPAIRSVRRAYPDAQLTLFTSPGPTGPGAAELLPGNDWIDEIRVYYSEDIQSMSGRLKLLRELRARRFDVWIEIPNNLSSISRQFRDMLFTWTVGVRWARGWRINAIRLAAQAQSEYLHFSNEVDRTLDVVRRAGISATEIDFGLPRLPAAQARIDELLLAEGLQSKVLIAIAPGAKRSTNHWPSERFAEVGRILADFNSAVVLIAGGAEAELCTGLASQIGAHAHSFAGELSLSESIELLRRCRLLICVDSGVQHLAAAVGTPCISLFSFWQMRGKWHPYGLQNLVLQKWVPCHTCLLEFCTNDNRCMKAIEVEEVVGFATRMLDLGQQSVRPPISGGFATVSKGPAEFRSSA
ncbi:MAG: asparagine synthase (glutamine-hydrolyzing) [Burkholderiales bacterium]|nr:asparagine synthase (glutamine-hydrolyzing) [Burkholderiales bacterium]